MTHYLEFCLFFVFFVDIIEKLLINKFILWHFVLCLLMCLMEIHRWHVLTLVSSNPKQEFKEKMMAWGLDHIVLSAFLPRPGCVNFMTSFLFVFIFILSSPTHVELLHFFCLFVLRVIGNKLWPHNFLLFHINLFFFLKPFSIPIQITLHITIHIWQVYSQYQKSAVHPS